MIRCDAVTEKRVELGELSGEIRLLRLVVKPLQCARGERQPAGRLAHAEVDAPGRDGRQHAKRFRDLVRAVMLKHHAARSDANSGRVREQMRHDDFRCRTREPGRAVVFRDPVALVA